MKNIFKMSSRIVSEGMGNFSLTKDNDMKTIKIIDLLTKKANGEELPKIIIYDSYIYRLESDDYFCDEMKNEWLFEDNAFTTEFLNEEIEILEEEKKKIPEKLKIEQATSTSNFYIKNEFGTKCYLTKHSKIIADKINKILDYLESEGK